LQRREQSPTETGVGVEEEPTQRTHPKRDPRTGRLQLGLEHVYGALKN
jgi:hypothetical protein